MERISNFQKRLVYLLDKFNYSQSEVVKRTGLNKGIVSRYVSGTALPKMETLNLIARAFFVNPLWLMGYDVDMYNAGGHSESYEKLKDLNEKLSDEQRIKVIEMIDIMFSIK